MSFLFVYVGKCLVLTAGCSPTRFTLAAGQVPHHIQARITDASDSLSAVSNVSVRPRRVQLDPSALSGDFVPQPPESYCRSTNQDSFRTAGLRYLRSRHPPAIRTIDSYPAFRRSLNTPTGLRKKRGHRPSYLIANIPKTP